MVREFLQLYEEQHRSLDRVGRSTLVDVIWIARRLPVFYT